MPGFRRNQTFAILTSSISLGSITISLAPLNLTAFLTFSPAIGCASVVLEPQTNITSAPSISSSELVAAPLPNAALSPVTDGAWHTLAQLSILLVPITARANF